MASNIRYLPRHALDATRWDALIAVSPVALPYAYSWYLDALCPQWVAIIMDDYKYIAPLPITRRWAISGVYQPLFCQQLGVYGRVADAMSEEAMVEFIRRRYSYIHLQFNYTNLKDKPLPQGMAWRKNLILDLSVSVDELRQNYAENTRRNIRKAAKADPAIEVLPASEYEAYISFYITHTAVRDPQFKAVHRSRLRALVVALAQRQMCTLYVVRQAEGQLCAGVMVVHHGNRLIHLLVASDDYARNHGIMSMLTDYILSQYAGRDLVYDFEGSTMPSIARYYESFGAVEQPYPELVKRLF